MTTGHKRKAAVEIRPDGPSYNSTCSKEPELVPSRQTPVCAQMALEHYNTTNQGDEHELVEAVESNAFVFNGVWIHANFLAKPIADSSCDVPNYFFAELKSDYTGFYCLSCVKMDLGEPRKLGGCGLCPRQIMHPVDGGYRGAKPFNDSPTTERCAFTF
nr:unnamed protein product [Digitaria exilis]